MIRIPRFDGGTQPSVYDIALKELMRDEGFLANPYFDPIGKVWTSGYGFTDPKHQHKWTEQEAREVLKQYIADKDKYARANAAWGQSYQSMSPQMQAEIINLMFQGGDAVIDKKMPKFRKALINRNWNEATKQLDFGMGQTTTRSKRRQTNFGNGIAMMNLERPTTTMDNVPTVEQVVEQAPAKQYNISQPVRHMMQNVSNNEDSKWQHSIKVPMYSPAPIYTNNFKLNTKFESLVPTFSEQLNSIINTGNIKTPFN